MKYKNAEISIQVDTDDKKNQLMKTILWKDIKSASNSLKNLPASVESTIKSVYIRTLSTARNKFKRFKPDVSIIVTVVLTEARYKKYNLSRTFDYPITLREAIKETYQQALKQARSQQNRINTSLYTLDCGEMVRFNGKRGNRTLSAPNQILDLHIKKNISGLYENKAPVENHKHIGIELEFCATIKEQELALKLFKKGIHRFAQLKGDGSLRPKDKEFGYELAILLKESSFKSDLKKITDLLTEIKASVKDRRCGLHVHLDMRNRNKDLVFGNLVACQKVLFSIIDPNRRDNEFCQQVSSKKFPTSFTGERHERYKTINAAAYYKYKTLEIRMHEGSVDFDQISSWADILIKIANYKKKIKGNIYKLSIFHKKLKLSKKLISYSNDRSCYWQVNGGSVGGRRVPPPSISYQEVPGSSSSSGGGWGGGGSYHTGTSEMSPRLSNIVYGERIGLLTTTPSSDMVNDMSIVNNVLGDDEDV